jgi:toxin CptA
MTSAPAIGFEYQPSRRFGQLLLIVALLAVLAVALCALPPWLKLLLVGVVALAAWHARTRFAGSSVKAAGWSDDTGWTLHLASHEDVPAVLASFRVLGGSVLLRMLTAEHGAQVLLLLPDNSDADIRRRLRMRLATLQPGEALPRL